MYIATYLKDVSASFILYAKDLDNMAWLEVKFLSIHLDFELSRSDLVKGEVEFSNSKESNH